jgi:hypothetical protein
MKIPYAQSFVAFVFPPQRADLVDPALSISNPSPKKVGDNDKVIVDLWVAPRN